MTLWSTRFATAKSLVSARAGCKIVGMNDRSGQSTCDTDRVVPVRTTDIRDHAWLPLKSDFERWLQDRLVHSEQLENRRSGRRGEGIPENRSLERAADNRSPHDRFHG